MARDKKPTIGGFFAARAEFLSRLKEFVHAANMLHAATSTALSVIDAGGSPKLVVDTLRKHVEYFEQVTRGGG